MDINMELKAARKKYFQASKALMAKWGKKEIAAFKVAEKKKITLERKISLANNLETALKIDWKPQWDIGAPSPYVISGKNQVFLMYLIKQVDPKWDGSYVKVINTKSNEIQPIALVKFTQSYAFKFGGMNDEVWEGHPLNQRGLEAYSAHIIKNSKWLKQEQKINSVHDLYNEKKWKTLNHYFLLFHDNTFECLAENFSIEIYNDSFKNVVKKTEEKLFAV